MTEEENGVVFANVNVVDSMFVYVYIIHNTSKQKDARDTRARASIRLHLEKMRRIEAADGTPRPLLTKLMNC